MSIAERIDQINASSRGLREVSGVVTQRRVPIKNTVGDYEIDEHIRVPGSQVVFASKSTLKLVIRDNLSRRDGNEIDVFLAGNLAKEGDFIKVGCSVKISGPPSLIGTVSCTTSGVFKPCIFICPDAFGSRQETRLASCLPLTRISVNDGRSDFRVLLPSEPVQVDARTPKRAKLAIPKRNEYVNLEDLFMKINEARGSGTRFNVFGVISSFSHRQETVGSDDIVNLTIIDPSAGTPSWGIPCNIFAPPGIPLPGPILLPGDIIRLHRCTLKNYNGWPQLVLRCKSGAWFLLRSLSFRRAALQENEPEIIYSGDADERNSGDSDNSDLYGNSHNYNVRKRNLDEQIAKIFPSAHWETQRSGDHASLFREDKNRFLELYRWFREESKRTALSLELPIGPEATEIGAKRKLLGGNPACVESLLKCLVGLDNGSEGLHSLGDLTGLLVDITRDKEEKLDKLMVWDSTGTATCPPNENALRAVRKGLGYAFSASNTPTGEDIAEVIEPSGNSQVLGSLLQVEVTAHSKALISMGIAAGMWVRFKKLQVETRAVSGFVGIFLGNISSLNILHPGMFEVKAILACHKSRTDQEMYRESPSMNEYTGPAPPIKTINGDTIYSLLDLMCVKAPAVFWVRVTILGHVPRDSKKFLKPLPPDSDQYPGLGYLFSLKLDDDSGQCEAVVTDKGVTGFLAPEEFDTNQSDLLGDMLHNIISTKSTVDLRIKSYYCLLDRSKHDSVEDAMAHDRSNLVKRYIVVGGTLIPSNRSRSKS